MKKVKGLRSTEWQLQNSHGDVKYSIEKRVNNIVTTMYGARWILDSLRGSFCKLYKHLTMLYT